MKGNLKIFRRFVLRITCLNDELSKKKLLFFVCQNSMSARVLATSSAYWRAEALICMRTFGGCRLSFVCVVWRAAMRAGIHEKRLLVALCHRSMTGSKHNNKFFKLIFFQKKGWLHRQMPSTTARLTSKHIKATWTPFLTPACCKREKPVPCTLQRMRSVIQRPSRKTWLVARKIKTKVYLITIMGCRFVLRLVLSWQEAAAFVFLHASFAISSLYFCKTSRGARLAWCKVGHAPISRATISGTLSAWHLERRDISEEAIALL